MTADALAFVQFFLSSTWQFFTEWKIPGTVATPASFLLLVAVVGFIWKYIRKILLNGGDD